MGRPTDFGKDQAMLALLKANARAPISDIAKTLGVSRATAQARLRRLEKEGYIAGYTIVTGAAGETTPGLSAVVLLELEMRKQASVIVELRRMAEAVSCHTLSGPFDLLVRIVAGTAGDLDAVIDRIAALDGVRRTNSSVLLARKFER